MKKVIEIGKVALTFFVLILFQIIQDRYFVSKDGLQLAFPPALIVLVGAVVGGVASVASSGIKARQAKIQAQADQKKRLSEEAIKARQQQEQARAKKKKKNENILVVASLAVISVGVVIFIFLNKGNSNNNQSIKK